MNINKKLNACNLKCPLPILKTKEILTKMKKNENLLVKTTDTNSEIDFKIFLKQTGHILLSFYKKNNKFYFLIKHK